MSKIFDKTLFYSGNFARFHHGKLKRAFGLLPATQATYSTIYHLTLPVHFSNLSSLLLLYLHKRFPLYFRYRVFAALGKLILSLMTYLPFKKKPTIANIVSNYSFRVPRDSTCSAVDDKCININLECFFLTY